MERLQKHLASLKDVKKNLNENYKYRRANRRQAIRRHGAERRFFDPDRNKSKAALLALTMQLIDHRFSLDDAKPEPIDVTGVSTRMLITAERVFQEAVVALSGGSSPRLGIPSAREKPWTMSEGYYGDVISGSTSYGPVEVYKLAKTRVEVEHRANPKSQRLGDSFFNQLGPYASIANFLIVMANDDPNNEKIIARLILRYGKNHQAVTKDDLKVFYPEADTAAVNKFNQICFLLMVKEQGQWHSATSTNFQIGMTVSQARCLRMIEAGFLRIKEALDKNALFGIYSHTGLAKNCREVAQSCRYVDSLYLQFLNQEHRQDHLRFFKAQVDDSDPSVAVISREQAHQDMLYAYGGESDSDGEGYESDLEFR